jgi:hypothetical protein
MRFVFSFLIILSLCMNVEAANFSLSKISDSEYERVTQKIQNEIRDDDTTQEILPFDKEQSFVLQESQHAQIGYLIPVKFNSKSYQNTICRLFFVNPHDGLEYADLFAEKNDGDDVVSSCVGIDAVSIANTKAGAAYYLALVRYRTVNTYGSKAVVATFSNGTLVQDKKINRCINSPGSARTIKALKTKLSSCI